MLTLFPFEKKFYQQKNTPVEYVGHPMAKMAVEWQKDDEFIQRHNPQGKRLVAVLPGSRMSEVSRLAPVMLAAIDVLATRYPQLNFVLPAANDKIKHYLQDELNITESPVTVIDGQSRELLAICDIALLASGTAALEAALFAKPMVVMYKVSKFTQWYASRTMVVAHYSMPNHLINPPIVPELIQDEATLENTVFHLSRLIDDPDYYENMHKALSEIAPALHEESGQLACDAIMQVIGQGNEKQNNGAGVK